MLTQFIDHVFKDTFLACCSSVMLILFAYDVFGLISEKFGISKFKSLDFKTAIVSIGLFGTFFGVLVGLYGFDTKAIDQSVPKLLEGLKFAFAISVLGMFLSITLSILDKFFGGIDDNADILKSIDRKLGGLTATLQSPTELVKQFSEMRIFLKNHLEKINNSLDQALSQLAKGATQEVVQALDRIIREFNSNLKEQFGENFKELNVACHKLVQWQENYRGHIEETEGRLFLVMKNLEDARLAVQELAESNQETKEICSQVAGLIGTYDIQIRTLATHLESCKTLGVQAGEFLNKTEKALVLSTDNLNNFSDVIENSVSKQSAVLSELTKDLDHQLPKALGELEKVLTNLTNQFAADYKSLFQFITDKADKDISSSRNGSK